MPDINEEMRLTAEFAISTAKERYGLVLDYSEESLAILDDVLEKIYWGFSSHARDEGEGGLIFNTAIIWGSYLGEYMRLKWGGTWLVNGTERRVSITSIEFSPISFVYQRITNHPEYRVQNYVVETKNVIYTSVIHPKKSQFVAESAGQPTKQVSSKPSKRPVNVDRRLVYIAGGVLGLLFIITVCMVGYAVISSGGLPAFGLFAVATNTSSATSSPTTAASPTLYLTDTPSPTVTELPTYTPKPTRTPLPSATPTPSSTFTEIPTETPTETFIPTDTYVPRKTSTPTTRPTEPPAPATSTHTPPPTATSAPPTPTSPPPPQILSCSVNPSTVTPGVPNDLTFAVHFSAPGYEITGMNFNPSWPGQQGCTGSGGDTVQCPGNSGLIPPATSVNVDIQTSLGSCSVSYGAP